MKMRCLLLALFAVAVLAAPSVVHARKDNAGPYKPATPLETFRAFKPPVVPTSFAQVRGETVEIEVMDASHHTLILDVGGERPPGTMLEMLRGTPRDDIVVKSARSAEDGMALERGGNEEKQVLRMLQEWREATAASASAKPGKKAPSEAQLKLADRVISMLKPRHPVQKPLPHTTR